MIKIPKNPSYGRTEEQQITMLKVTKEIVFKNSNKCNHKSAVLIMHFYVHFAHSP